MTQHSCTSNDRGRTGNLLSVQPFTAGQGVCSEASLLVFSSLASCMVTCTSYSTSLCLGFLIGKEGNYPRKVAPAS